MKIMFTDASLTQPLIFKQQIFQGAQPPRTPKMLGFSTMVKSQREDAPLLQHWRTKTCTTFPWVKFGSISLPGTPKNAFSQSTLRTEECPERLALPLQAAYRSVRSTAESFGDNISLKGDMFSTEEITTTTPL
jgi:hypothetical protein